MQEFPRRYVMGEGYMTALQQGFLIEYIRQHEDIKNILEIGFNGGHGSCALLTARDDITVTSVDIYHHEYIDKAKNLIDECFPGRHTLIKGDSTEVVPKLTQTFDLVFVDGYHVDPVPYKDIVNSHRILKDDGIIIVDDYCLAYGTSGVIQGYNKAVDEKLYSHIDIFTFEDRGLAIARKNVSGTWKEWITIA